VLFINVPRFLLSLKDSISTHNDYVEHIKKNILNVDLVVWDELGIKNATQFEHEHLLNLINTRIDYNKSNIYTSNLSSDELKERLGDRLHSRIVNLSTDIELFGSDKRGTKS
jgi:DNA replication protein DnaC